MMTMCIYVPPPTGGFQWLSTSMIPGFVHSIWDQILDQIPLLSLTQLDYTPERSPKQGFLLISFINI